MLHGLNLYEISRRMGQVYNRLKRAIQPQAQPQPQSQPQPQTQVQPKEQEPIVYDGTEPPEVKRRRLNMTTND